MYYSYGHQKWPKRLETESLRRQYLENEAR